MLQVAEMKIIYILSGLFYEKSISFNEMTLCLMCKITKLQHFPLKCCGYKIERSIKLKYSSTCISKLNLSTLVE